MNKLKLKLRLKPFLFILDTNGVYEQPDGEYNVYGLYKRVLPFIYKWTGVRTISLVGVQRITKDFAESSDTIRRKVMSKLPSELCKYCTSKHSCSGYAKCRKLTRLEASINIPKKEIYNEK